MLTETVKETVSTADASPREKKIERESAPYVSVKARHGMID